MYRRIMGIGLVCLFTLPLLAGTRSGVTMSDSIVIDNQTLELNGLALRKKVIFKVYVAGLYLPQKQKSAEAILAADEMRCMQMHFVRSVDASKINEGWRDGLSANTANASPELKKQFDTLYSWMEKVKDGDLLSFTYIPGQGTRVKVKGQLKGTLEGKAFADALLACWIGPKPGPGEGFKRDILGL